MRQRSGQCLCGAVKFTLTAEPLAVRVCWCRDCQHLAGNGMVNMLVKADDLAHTGALSGHDHVAASGNIITREFCPGCGTHLFAKANTRPQFRVVRAGNLDNPSSVRPDMNIWTASAPEWACLDQALAQFPGQSPPPAPPATAA